MLMSASSTIIYRYLLLRGPSHLRERVPTPISCGILAYDYGRTGVCQLYQSSREARYDTLGHVVPSELCLSLRIGRPNIEPGTLSWSSAYLRAAYPKSKHLRACNGRGS